MYKCIIHNILIRLSDEELILLEWPNSYLHYIIVRVAIIGFLGRGSFIDQLRLIESKILLCIKENCYKNK